MMPQDSVRAPTPHSTSLPPTSILPPSHSHPQDSLQLTDPGAVYFGPKRKFPFSRFQSQAQHGHTGRRGPSTEAQAGYTWVLGVDGECG